MATGYSTSKKRGCKKGNDLPSSYSETSEIENVLYNNLIVLKFDPIIEGKKYKTTFQRNMFHFKNKIAFEVVNYFLFCKLDKKFYQDLFKPHWPVLDKKDESEFCRICFESLIKISKNDSPYPFPHLRLSTLQGQGGEKFCELYLYFSCFVLDTITSRDVKKDILPFPSGKSLNPPLYNEVLKVAGKVAFDSFISTQVKAEKMHQEWASNASELMASYHSLQAEIKVLEEKQKVLAVKLTKNGNIDESEAIKNIDKLSQQVQKSWLSVEELLNKCHSQWTNLSPFLKMSRQTEALDSMDISPELRHQLKNDSEVMKNDKIDVLSLFQQGNNLLKHYDESISLEKWVNLDVEKLRSLEEGLQNQLHGVQSLRNSLTERNSNLQSSIENLRQTPRNSSSGEMSLAFGPIDLKPKSHQLSKTSFKEGFPKEFLNFAEICDTTETIPDTELIKESKQSCPVNFDEVNDVKSSPEQDSNLPSENGFEKELLANLSSSDSSKLLGATGISTFQDDSFSFPCLSDSFLVTKVEPTSRKKVKRDLKRVSLDLLSMNLDDAFVTQEEENGDAFTKFLDDSAIAEESLTEPDSLNKNASVSSNEHQELANTSIDDIIRRYRNIQQRKKE